MNDLITVIAIFFFVVLPIAFVWTACWAISEIAVGTAESLSASLGN